MKYSFETVKYEHNLPAKILMQDKPGWRSRTKLHWHKEFELLYIIDGKLEMTKNGRKFELETDSVIVVNSEEIHIVDVDDDERVNKYIVVQLSYEFAKQFYKKLDTVYFNIADNPDAQQKLKNSMRHLAFLTSHIEEDEFTDLQRFGEILNIYHTLFAECMQQKKFGLNDKNSANFRYAKTVIEYIGENYKDEITLNDMAALVGLSPAYFSKYFKNVTETNFINYLNGVRLEHALKDMMSRNLSVLEAAMENGFPNVKSFISMCKKVYGMTPTQCKKASRLQ